MRCNYELINTSGVNIVWFGLGTIPLQKEWIYRNKSKWDNIYVILRYLVEEKPRESKFIQKIGIEWFCKTYY
ncbi:WecB/TagA/CpsF family glycosyltransferase [Marivirga sp. S37H4]|uniref:WecB/TagA/CpsF family glycosyltransferase n=1 Tax=Marivirga aurantiaca TaxID=2802615 RepID=A0A934X2A0_9BACT|nr:WecB/TagA/CpsF family glycosyltransferase [Marivirga aurantiaca]